MNYRAKSILFWILSVLLMIAIAYYQRLTGPTHPKRVSVEIEGEKIKTKMLTSADTGKDAEIRIKVKDQAITGVVHYKRFKSFDEWTTKELVEENGELVAYIPEQPAAGKVMYTIDLTKNDRNYTLKDEPTIMRFKGSVPAFVLIPHILFMFLAMVFSMRTGFEAIIHGKKILIQSWLTVIFLFLGGLVLGPIVQKYAFDAYWTGWPFGHDLTDNKTIVSFLFWVIALILNIRAKGSARTWTIIAAIVLLAIYLIPHSVLGSEIDYTQAGN